MTHPLAVTSMRPLLILIVLATPASAACPEGQTPASCTLHEEAVVLFKSGKHEEAAVKFRAAIAAGPTARSYLGYSQAVEGQGKVALAYETMLVAQKLSKEEMATGASDDAILARSERIKYKLGELGAKVAYVWLRLPEGVPSRRVVSIYRQGEGDLPSPFGRWIIVAPEKQIMYASLDDGSRVEMTAAIAPGAQGQLVIPIAAAARPPQPQPQPPRPQPPHVGTQPGFPPQPQPGHPPAPGPVTGRPIQDIYKPPVPPPAKEIPATFFAIDLVFLAGNMGDVGTGTGISAVYERKISRPLALYGRFGFVFHPESDITNSTDSVVTARDIMLMAGVRTRSKLPVYASFEAGALVYNHTITSLSLGEFQYNHTYPTIALGGGYRFGKFHLEANVVYSINPECAGDPSCGIAEEPEMPMRFMFGLGYDVIRH